MNLAEDGHAIFLDTFEPHFMETLGAKLAPTFACRASAHPTSRVCSHIFVLESHKNQSDLVQQPVVVVERCLDLLGVGEEQSENIMRTKF